jgi:hypothetical protein
VTDQPPPKPLLAHPIGHAFAVRVLDAQGDPYPAYFRHQSAAQAWGATNYPERFIVDRCDLASYDPDEQPAAFDPTPNPSGCGHYKDGSHCIHRALHEGLHVFPDGSKAPLRPCEVPCARCGGTGQEIEAERRAKRPTVAELDAILKGEDKPQGTFTLRLDAAEVQAELGRLKAMLDEVEQRHAAELAAAREAGRQEVLEALAAKVAEFNDDIAAHHAEHDALLAKANQAKADAEDAEIRHGTVKRIWRELRGGK